MPLTSIQTIKKFYNKKDALKAASYFKNQYKKIGQKVTIEIIEAYKVSGSVKKSIGSPRPDDYIIFIKHQTTPVVKKIIQKIKSTIKKTKNIVSKGFKLLVKKQAKPAIMASMHHFNKTEHLQPTYRPKQIAIIAPISLYRRHTA